MVATPAGDTAASPDPGGAGATTTRVRATTSLLIAGRVAPLPGDEGSATALEQRILDAALVCIARWGVAKTTLDDIAREARCSRATVYRLVPGGKDGLMLAAAERELARFFAHLAERLEAESTLVGRLAVGIAESMLVVSGHEALQYLVEHEPEVVLPFVSFDALDPLFGAAASFGAATLGTFLEPADARAIGEWVARIVVSYGFEPDDSLDLTDARTAERFVLRYLPHLNPAGAPALSPADARRTEQERTHVQH